MVTSHRLLVLVMVPAVFLLTPQCSPAAVAPRLPQLIVVDGMDAFPDMIFVVYTLSGFDAREHPSQKAEKAVRIDPKTAERYRTGAIVLPHGLQAGKLSLLGVPRAMAEKSKEVLDPAWLDSATPGILRISGTIHHLPVERSTTPNGYRIEKTESGLKLTLENPEVLQPYPPERLDGPEQKPQSNYLWAIIAGVVLVFLAAAWAFWNFGRDQPSAGTGPEAPSQ